MKRGFLDSASGNFLQPGDGIEVGGTRAGDLERLGLIEPAESARQDEKASPGVPKNKDAAQQRKNKGQDGPKQDEKASPGTDEAGA